MPKLTTIFIILMLLLPISSAMANDADLPTIAILRFGSLRTFDTTEGAILDVLESYGYISSEENTFLHTRQDLEGENIHIIWGSANFDFPTAALILDNALDHEPDVLITLTTTITELALSATADMEDPPVVLFTSVYNPYEAGIASSACIKPDHITGSLSSAPYEDVLSLLVAQNPDIKTIGTIYNSAESAGAVGVDEITRIGELLGLKVIATAVTNISEINLAAEGLISKGIDAFVMPIDLRTGAAGLPIIVNLANEYGVPVFHPILFSIYYGATISSGFYHYYAQGENVGVLVAAYLNGEIDVATTAINEQSGTAIGVNLDMAGRQGIEISDEIIENADAIIEGGEATVADHIAQQLAIQGAIVPLEERLQADRELLANLACTPERIAAEQAELDARDE